VMYFPDKTHKSIKHYIRMREKGLILSVGKIQSYKTDSFFECVFLSILNTLITLSLECSFHTRVSGVNPLKTLRAFYFTL